MCGCPEKEVGNKYATMPTNTVFAVAILINPLDLTAK